MQQPRGGNTCAEEYLPLTVGRGMHSEDEISGRRKEDMGEGQSEGPLTSAAVVFMLVTLSLCLAFGVYFSLVGWYGNLFGSRALFTWMTLATFLPGPPMILLQTVLDSRYTTHFGAEVAYSFRICATLGITGACTMLMPLCKSASHVLMLGFVIGALSRAGISATMQLASAVDSSMPRYVLLGCCLAQGVTILLWLASHLQAASPISTAVMFCLPPAVIILFVSASFLCVSLTYFHGSAQFLLAYERLFAAADLHEQQGIGTSLETWLPCSSTVRWYYVRHGIQWFLDSLALPFVTYVGTYDLAAQLMLVIFFAQLIGSTLAIMSPYFLKALGCLHMPFPMHEFVLFFQGVSLMPLFFNVFGLMAFGEQSEMLLKLTLGFSYVLSRYAASENSVGALAVVAPHHHPFVSRALLLINASVQLATSLCTLAVINLTGLSE